MTVFDARRSVMMQHAPRHPPRLGSMELKLVLKETLPTPATLNKNGAYTNMSPGA